MLFNNICSAVLVIALSPASLFGFSINQSPNMGIRGSNKKTLDKELKDIKATDDNALKGVVVFMHNTLRKGKLKTKNQYYCYY